MRAHASPLRQHVFAGSEVYQDACAARSTIFTANIAAVLMIERFSRHLRGISLDAHLQLNLLTSEMSVTEPDHRSRLLSPSSSRPTRWLRRFSQPASALCR